MSGSKRTSGRTTQRERPVSRTAPGGRPLAVRVLAGLLVFGLLAGLIATVVAVSAGEDDPTPPAPQAVDLPLPPPGETLTGPTPCPALDGSSLRTTTFAEPSAGCLDPDATYAVTIFTSRGVIEATLDPANAPEAVNEFVTLAGYHYWDELPFELVLDSGLLAAGAYRVEDRVGPGYDLTVDPPAAEPVYGRGDLVLMVTSDGRASARFAVVTSDGIGAFLGPNDQVIGSITEGIEIADDIASFAGSSVGAPVADVRIQSVVVSETPAGG